VEIKRFLPVAVKEDKASLPAGLLEELKPLKTRRPGRFFLEAAYCWAVVFGAIAVAVQLDNWLVSTIAIFIVATRQNVLALLVHEQTHCTALKAYPGDIVTNLIAAYPLMVLTVEGYAQVHLAHHGKYFTEDDPDHRRKSGDEWNYPMAPRKFLKILLGDVLGLNVINLVKGKKAASNGDSFARRTNMPQWLRPCYFLALITALTVTGTWGIFLLYWVLPLVTITQLIIRWGAVCEHQYNRLGASVQETSPLIVLTWWERLLLPNLNFTYHIYHHYFPGISFSQLPRVHEAFVRYGLVDDSAVFHGYRSYLKFLLSGQAEGGQAVGTFAR
jgi:fatty acid desaturase